MNVLILGSGGREHALSWKISKSSELDQLYIAPGNGGTSTIGTNVNISIADFEAIGDFVLEKNISLMVVGPEAPLVDGITDYFKTHDRLKHIAVIGTSKEGAQLEGSKEFAKEFMKRNKIPTAAYASFSAENINEGYQFLESLTAPYVLKADGLAGGKGVVILDDLNAAKNELKLMLEDAKFGAASKTVVIEEFLDGIEVSAFILTDGISYKLLPFAKDYKRIGEADTGLNTGGMGAISPVPFVDKRLIEKIENRVIIPSVAGLEKEKIDYKGFLFIGLMIVKGDPFVIEYNVRLGDPETEVILPRLRSDLLDLFEGLSTETLSERDIQVDPRTAATIMLVAGGYPEDYEKGKEITGLENIKDSIVFHAGTKQSENKIVTNGGRVLAVTSIGDTLEKAVNTSLASAEKINYDKKYYRKDIGKDLMKYTKKA